LRNRLLNIYATLFGRPGFIKLNRFLFHAALKGMGVLNYHNDRISGEDGFLRRFLAGKKSPVVLDVGSNVGRYAQMVLHYNPESVVHCFEPHPSTFMRLQENFSDTSHKVTMVNKGVGVEDAVLSLYDYSSEEGTSHASIHKGVIEEMHQQDAVAVQVGIINLKSYLKDNQIQKVDLLKIDTEGNELNVLKGLEEYLSPDVIKTIHFEFNEMNILSKCTFKDFWDLLSDYKLYRLLPNGRMLRIEQYIAAESELYAYQNIVAIAS
jgi:FkbM family methyltransferase